MRLLSSSDVRSVLAGTDAREGATRALEAALLEMATDSTDRTPHLTPTRPASPTVITATGAVEAFNGMGGRINCVGKPSRTDGRRHGAFKFLYERDTLNLVALIEDEPAQPLMLGTRVAIATARLSRPDARVLGVIGSGRMAAASLDAISTVRPLTHVRVYSPEAAHRSRFADDAARRLGVEVSAVESAQDAVSGADIVTCATNAVFRGSGPVFEAAWLEPGTHVNSIARAEIPRQAFLDAKVFPVSLPDVLAISPPWDDIGILMSSGEVSIDSDLAHVVAGGAGRTTTDEITIYLGPSTGAEHVAIGWWIYELALAKGVGVDWDLDRELDRSPPTS